MKHFDISEWTDYARGVAPDVQRAAMDTHALSCVRCRSTLDLVQRVAECARAESGYEPPEQAVKWAKAISALLSPRKSWFSRLVPRLVYDSLRDPVLVGLRAEDRVSHHVLYEAGDFNVDLRVEQEKGSRLVTLVGQLTNRLEPESPLAEAPVLLLERKDIVAHAVYNRFGEFQMDYPPTRHLRLCIAVGAPGIRIELPLRQLMTAMPELKTAKSLPSRPKRTPTAQLEQKRSKKSPRRV
jgi:hypothetical protein